MNHRQDDPSWYHSSNRQIPENISPLSHVPPAFRRQFPAASNKKSSHPIEISTINKTSSNFLAGAFNQEEFSDFQIKFSSSGNTLFVHRVILAKGSEFFDVCLHSQMKESLVQTMDIDDTLEDEKLFTEMIKSLYTGKVELSETSSLVPLLKMAGKYGIASLEKELANYLQDHLTDENLLSCYTLDSSSLKLQELFQRVRSRLNFKAQELLSSNKIVELDYFVIHQILSDMSSPSLLSLSLDTVVRWIEHDEHNRAQYTFPLTKLINGLTRRSRRDSFGGQSAIDFLSKEKNARSSSRSRGNSHC